VSRAFFQAKEANPKGHMNAIIPRSEKQLDEPKAVKERRVNLWSRKRENH